MHALPSYPRHPVLLGLIVLLVALLAMAAAAPELGTLDFSVRGGAESAPAAADARGVESAPTWATDPLAPPLEQLSR
jgi:hypothetical protein